MGGSARAEPRGSLNTEMVFPPVGCDVIDCYGDSEWGGVEFKPVVGNAISWLNVYPMANVESVQ